MGHSSNVPLLYSYVSTALSGVERERFGGFGEETDLGAMFPCIAGDPETPGSSHARETKND